MLPAADTEIFLRKKKLLVLLCGVVIFFLTSMAKVLIGLCKNRDHPRKCWKSRL